MGLCPPKVCRHPSKSTGTVPCDTSRRAVSVFIAAALFSATASPLPAVGILTKDDVDVVTKIVKESEERTKDRMEVNMGKQSNMFIGVPIASAAIAGIITGLSNVYTSLKLDNTVERFSASKENIKKELEAGTQAKATNGAILGAIIIAILGSAIILFLIGTGATIAFATNGGFIHTP